MHKQNGKIRSVLTAALLGAFLLPAAPAFSMDEKHSHDKKAEAEKKMDKAGHKHDMMGHKHDKMKGCEKAGEMADGKKSTEAEKKSMKQCMEKMEKMKKAKMEKKEHSHEKKDDHGQHKH